MLRSAKLFGLALAVCSEKRLNSSTRGSIFRKITDSINLPRPSTLLFKQNPVRENDDESDSKRSSGFINYLSTDSDSPTTSPDLSPSPCTTPENFKNFLAEKLNEFGKLQLRQMNNNKCLKIIGDFNSINVQEIIAYRPLLEVLIIKDTRMVEIPQGLSGLKNLARIVIESNNCLRKCDNIAEVSQVKELYLINNPNLKRLPRNISTLDKLEQFTVTESPNIKNIKNITQCLNLIHLKASGVGLEKIPDDIGKLVNLTSLDLSNNSLKSTPHSFYDLTKLTKLSLQVNNFSSLPSDFSKLKELKQLNLSSNKLKSFDFAFPHLSILDLSENQISSLNGVFLNNTSLTVLDLNFNKLTLLPKEINKLAKLKMLKVACNELKILDEELYNMTELKYFNVCFNKIDWIPYSFFKINRFESFMFAGNLTGRRYPIPALGNKNELAFALTFPHLTACFRYFDFYHSSMLDMVLKHPSIKSSEVYRRQIGTILEILEGYGGIKEPEIIMCLEGIYFEGNADMPEETQLSSFFEKIGNALITMARNSRKVSNFIIDTQMLVTFAEIYQLKTGLTEEEVVNSFSQFCLKNSNRDLSVDEITCITNVFKLKNTHCSIARDNRVKNLLENFGYADLRSHYLLI